MESGNRDGKLLYCMVMSGHGLRRPLLVCYYIHTHVHMNMNLMLGATSNHLIHIHVEPTSQPITKLAFDQGESILRNPRESFLRKIVEHCSMATLSKEQRYCNK